LPVLPHFHTLEGEPLPPLHIGVERGMREEVFCTLGGGVLILRTDSGG